LLIYIECDYREDKIIVTNNLQQKHLDNTPGRGLSHLKKKFELLNLPQLHINCTAEAFVVSFPLIKNNCYEGINH
jgi:hypothetical protein